mgnify:CR=1 FL=1
MRFLVALLFITNISCMSSPTGPSGARNAFTLRFGETAIVDGARISFTDVSDSRCPTEVVCAWAGDAAVRLESGSESVVLHTNATAGPASGPLAGITATLVDVRPERIAVDPPAKSAYVISLRLAAER